MSTGRTPDERAAQDVQDARIADVLREALTDCMFLTAAVELGEHQAVCDLWQTRMLSRLRRDLATPDDLVRAVEMLLTEPAYRLAADLLYTVRDVDPDDLLDGPWSP